MVLPRTVQQSALPAPVGLAAEVPLVGLTPAVSGGDAENQVLGSSHSHAVQSALDSPLLLTVLKGMGRWAFEECQIIHY